MAGESIHFIGEYQLGNLIANGIPFLLVSLTDIEDRKDHPLLAPAVRQSFEGLVQFVEEKVVDKSSPVVLICRDGAESFQGASNLMLAGYINVFVLEGGLNELS